LISTQADRDGMTILADALVLAQALSKEASTLGLALAGIGVGVAELVDLEGNVTSGHTIQWQALPVRERFSQLAPAVIESDVRAAALAESKFGAGRSFKIFVYVTVGTGISCCLMQEGRPFAGARGNALVFSSSPLTTTCTSCGTVLRPILEEFASGPALVRRYNHHCTAQIQSGEGVLLAVESGDVVAAEVVRTAGEALGVSVAFLVNTLDPEAVIVGGGLGLAGGLYWSSFTRSAREHIWAEAARNLPILQASLGTDAGLIGAAATVLQRRQLSHRL
jgi:glucokinase